MKISTGPAIYSLGRRYRLIILVRSFATFAWFPTETIDYVTVLNAYELPLLPVGFHPMVINEIWSNYLLSLTTIWRLNLLARTVSRWVSSYMAT